MAFSPPSNERKPKSQRAAVGYAVITNSGRPFGRLYIRDDIVAKAWDGTTKLMLLVGDGPDEGRVVLRLPTEKETPNVTVSKVNKSEWAVTSAKLPDPPKGSDYSSRVACEIVLDQKNRGSLYVDLPWCKKIVPSNDDIVL